MGSSDGGHALEAVRLTDVARKWRVPEFVGLGLLVAVVMLIEESVPEYEQFIPPINGESVNGYPVRLGSAWCTASDLASCHYHPSSACCTELKAGRNPGETVPELMLMLIVFGVPLAFITFRQVLTKYELYRGSSTLPELLLGLGLCLGLAATVTDGIKKGVGRPRPNYFALRAAMDYSGGRLSSLKGQSIRSFPSGHSSMSMAGTLYVTLVSWAELSRSAAARKGWLRSVLACVCFSPACIALWVGVTRIRDYWHFQDDVATGWAIGAASAAIAVRWVTFPEAFWRGAARVAARPSRDVRSLRDAGAMALMLGPGPSSKNYGSGGSEASVDLEGGGPLPHDSP